MTRAVVTTTDNNNTGNDHKNSNNVKKEWGDDFGCPYCLVCLFGSDSNASTHHKIICDLLRN